MLGMRGSWTGRLAVVIPCRVKAQCCTRHRALSGEKNRDGREAVRDLILHNKTTGDEAPMERFQIASMG